MELSQAISQAIKEFGKEIITEPRFVNILADYNAFAEARVLRTVIRDMVDQGFTRRILVRDTDIKHAGEVTKCLVYDALNLFPYREELIHTVVSTLVCCIIRLSATSTEKERTDIPFYLDNNNNVLDECKYKTKKDFCYIGNLVLGETNCTKAKQLGYNVTKTECCNIISRVIKMSFGSFSYDDTKECFNEYFCYGGYNKLPSEWEKLGLFYNLSYDDFTSLFEAWGFYITIIKKPVARNCRRRKVLKAEISVESYDHSITFILGFDYGNVFGEGASTNSQNSLYKIIAKVH